MQTSNLIIQSLWIGPKLGTMEIMCINSYLKKGHQFHLYTYDMVSGVPGGAKLMDANIILSQKDIFIDPFGGFVNLSNLFRYTLLFKLGGWWVDMDTVCLKYFDFNDPFVFSSESSPFYDRYLINTTFIKCPPHSKLMQDCLDFLRYRGTSNIHWGELGVNLISRMVLRNDLQHFVRAHDIFCPISAHELLELINRKNYTPPVQSYAIHWWNEIWKIFQIDKDRSFPPQTIYEMMKNEFLHL